MSVKDLISAAFNKDANSFESTLHAIMQEKMSAAIQARFSPAVYEEEVDLDEAKDDSEDDESTEEDDDEEDMKEEVELDEVSGATLGSYYVKARKSKDAAQSAMADTHKSIKSADDVPAAIAKNSALQKTVSKRNRGMSRAMEKLTGSAFSKVHAKEEVEQIDEISASTLGSYVRKGTKDIEKSYDEREKARDAEDSKTARAMGLRARKREKGVSDAISKLTGHYTVKVPAGDK